MLLSVDIAHYGVSRAKDWVSVDCGTTLIATAIKIIPRLVADKGQQPK